MPGQRAHHVVQALADQHDVGALGLDLAQFFHACRLQARLDEIGEILLAQQVQAVLADAAQQGVQHPRGKTRCVA